MSVKEIETAITQLPVKDLNELVFWIEEYHANLWDKQIGEDAEIGRLDGLIAEAEQEYPMSQKEMVLSIAGKVQWEGNLVTKRRTRQS